MKKIIKMMLAIVIATGLAMTWSQTASAGSCDTDADCPAPDACIHRSRCVPFKGESLGHVSERGLEKAGSCRVERKRNCCTTNDDCLLAGEANALTCVKEGRGKKVSATDAGKCRAVKNVGREVSQSKQTAPGKKEELKITITEDTEGLKAVSEKVNELLSTGETFVVMTKEADSQSLEPQLKISIVEGGSEIKEMDIGTAPASIIKTIALDPELTVKLLSPEESKVLRQEDTPTITTTIVGTEALVSEDLVVLKIAEPNLQLVTVRNILNNFTNFTEEKTTSPED